LPSLPPGRRLFLCESRRSVAELVNPLRCVGLRERVVKFFARLPAQGLQIRALRVRHRLIPDLPFRFALESRLVCIIASLFLMGRIDSKTKAKSSAARGRQSVTARFIEPMLLLRTDSLPTASNGSTSSSSTGIAPIAFKRNDAVQLRSRNDNDFNGRYPAVVEALARLPDNTVIDGEVVAFDQEGRPSFNALQNYGSAPGAVMYYVFDVMVLAGQNVMREPLEKRRELLEKKVLPKLPEPIRYSAPLDADLPVQFNR
jgi:ATP dependent DNA ligase domain